MPVITTIQPPSARFKERILMFGEGGSGKSTNFLNMARYMPYAHFWVNETDLSSSAERIMALEYPDVYERDQVTVRYSSDWEEYIENKDYIVAHADAANDVLVVDNGTSPWGWVQNSHIQAQYGKDVDEFLSELRKQFSNQKEYLKALSEAMQWTHINKKFTKHFYDPIHKWKGHCILITEAKTTKGEKDADLLAQFQTYGAMPAGQGKLPYVMSTNMLCMARPGNTWAFTTTKDRGRSKVERHKNEEFAMDYLVDVAGWTVERERT